MKKREYNLVVRTNEEGEKVCKVLKNKPSKTKKIIKLLAMGSLLGVTGYYVAKTFINKNM